jgi:hypothetical protein
MRLIGRLGLALVAGVTAVLFVALAPENAPSSAAEDEGLAAYRTGETARRSDKMDAQRDVVMARVLAKVRVTDALYRGDLTLDQAVERFRELGDSDPEVMDAMRARYGVSADQVYYRNVLDFARGAARRHPDRANVVLPRLEAEVVRRFPGAGTAQLAVQ